MDSSSLNFILSSEALIKPYWALILFVIIYLVLFRKHFQNAFNKIIGITKNENSLSKNLFFLIELALFFSFAIVVWELLLVDKNIKDFGQWGDFLGGILNPILTFLTFIGLIITIAIQQSELKLSREEFSKSANALEQQSKHLELQGFENTFFKMVDLHNSIVDSLYFDLGLIYYNFNRVESNKYKSRFVFNAIIKEIGKSHKINILRYKIIFLIKHNQVLGQYFRNLYQILKFIDRNEKILKNDILTYSKIVRAQLSTDELIVIFINAIAYLDYHPKNKKMIEFLVKFSMLKYLPIKEVNTNKNISIIFFNDLYIELEKNILQNFFIDEKSAFDGNDKIDELKRALK